MLNNHRWEGPFCPEDIEEANFYMKVIKAKDEIIIKASKPGFVPNQFEQDALELIYSGLLENPEYVKHMKRVWSYLFL